MLKRFLNYAVFRTAYDALRDLLRRLRYQIKYRHIQRDDQ